jgi:hypothetical protein
MLDNIISSYEEEQGTVVYVPFSVVVRHATFVPTFLSWQSVWCLYPPCVADRHCVLRLLFVFLTGTAFVCPFVLLTST